MHILRIVTLYTSDWSIQQIGLMFKEIAELLSKVIVTTYIPTINVWEFLFLHILDTIYCVFVYNYPNDVQ